MQVEYLATISLPDEGWGVNDLGSNAAGGLKEGLLLLIPYLGLVIANSTDNAALVLYQRDFHQIVTSL